MECNWKKYFQNDSCGGVKTEENGKPVFMACRLEACEFLIPVVDFAITNLMHNLFIL